MIAAVSSTPAPNMASPAPANGANAKAPSSFDDMVAAAPQAKAPPVAAKQGRSDDAKKDDSKDDKKTADAKPVDGAAQAALAVVLPGTQAAVPTTTTANDAGDKGGKTAAVQPDGSAAAAATQAPAAAPEAAAEFDIAALFPGLGDAAKTAAPAAPVKGTTKAPVKGAPADDAKASLAAVPAKAEASAPAALLDASAAAIPAGLAPQHGHQPALSLDAGSAQPSTAPADASVQNQLDVAHNGEWLDRLAHDIAGAGTTDGKLSFRLNPDHLGTLKVDLSNSAEGTSVRLTTDSEAARTLLTDNQSRLFAEARAQGVRLADARIDYAGPGTQTSNSGLGNQPHQQQQQNQATQPVFVTAGATTNRPIAEIDATPAASSGERYA
jgi:flagellar hook-length control protein FliK